MKNKQLKALLLPALKQHKLLTISIVDEQDNSEIRSTNMVTDLSIIGKYIILKMTEAVIFDGSVDSYYEKIQDLPDDYEVLGMEADSSVAVLTKLDFENDLISFDYTRLIPEYIKADLQNCIEEKIILESFDLDAEYDFSKVVKDSEEDLFQEFIYGDDFDIDLPDGQFFISVNYVTKMYTYLQTSDSEPDTICSAPLSNLLRTKSGNGYRHINLDNKEK